MKSEHAEMVERLNRAGAQMSNICFNLKQRAHLSVDERRSMESAQTEWDEASRALAALRAPSGAVEPTAGEVRAAGAKLAYAVFGVKLEPIPLPDAGSPVSPSGGAVVDGQAAGHQQESLLEWAVGRWNHEVKNRPLRNVHRSALDTTWRQVIRHFGGNPEVLCGPDHYALVEANPSALTASPAPVEPTPTTGLREQAVSEAMIQAGAAAIKRLNHGATPDVVIAETVLEAALSPDKEGRS